MTDAKLLPAFERRELEGRGLRLRYYVAGQGRPLVLIHGLGGLAQNWSLLAPVLARRRRVLVPDLPGHGGSSPLPAASSLDAFAEAVALVARREACEPAAVAGHSLGGAVALRLALRRPAAVSALVLAAAAGISSSSRRAALIMGALGAFRPARRIAPLRTRIADSERLRKLALGGWGAADAAALSAQAAAGFLEGGAANTDARPAWHALAADDPRLDLGGIECPCLVLWGARDRQVPIEDGFAYARRLRAPLRTIPDCGHLLIGERPEACRDAIETFLDRLD